MSRKLLYSLVVVCLTLLVFTWMVRDSLCEVRINQGNTEFAAFLNYEGRRYPKAGCAPPFGGCLCWLRAPFQQTSMGRRGASRRVFTAIAMHSSTGAGKTVSRQISDICAIFNR